MSVRWCSRAGPVGSAQVRRLGLGGRSTVNGRGQPTDDPLSTHCGPAGPPRDDADHGQVLPGRAPGLHLSDEGRAQAEAVAERIAALVGADRPGPVAVYASPLERTTETAKPIARRLGLRVRAERGLLECDFGEWTGAKLGDLAKKPEWTQRAALAERVPLPGRRVVPRDAGADDLGPGPAGRSSTRVRPSWPCPTPIPSRRPCRRRPVPRSTCSSG